MGTFPPQSQSPSAALNPQGDYDLSSLLTGLVAHWPFDEASGNALDAHASSLDLTDTNTVGVSTERPGVSRKSTTANSEYFVLANASAGDLKFGDEDFALSIWFNTSAWSGITDANLFSIWNNVNGQRAYYLKYDQSDNSLRWIVSGDGTAFTAMTHTVTLALNTWYHALAYHDSVGNVIGVYLNGANHESAAHTGGCYSSVATADFQIGLTAATGSTTAWSRACIFGEIPSASDITSIYNSGKGLKYADMSAALQAKVVGAWDLDEPTDDDDAVDDSGNGLTLTSNGVGVGDNVPGTARDFELDNSEDFVRTFNASEGWVFTGHQAFTVTLWAKWETLGTNYLIGQDKSGNRGWSVLRTGGGGSPFRMVASSDGSAVTTCDFGSGPSADTWYFIVAYHDPVTDLIGISIDDSAFVTAAHSGGIYDSQNDLVVGDIDSLGQNHDGLISDVNLYNRVLTAAEITALAAAEPPEYADYGSLP